MTPELQKACEIVFQEHKTSANPIVWNINLFNGRISLGLREKAKETLLQRKVIIYPNPTKKIITGLNPLVSAANNYNEAVELASRKVQVPVITTNNTTTDFVPKATVINRPAPVLYKSHAPRTASVATLETDLKWYLKPVYYYVIWPLCGAAAGAFLAYLIGNVANSI